MKRKTNYIYGITLDIQERSFTEVKGLSFPLLVHVKDIKSSYTENLLYKINITDFQVGKIDYSVDLTKSPFEDQYGFEILIDRLKFIYNFIDWELYDFDLVKFKDATGIYSEKDFLEFVLKKHFFTLEDIVKIETELSFLIGKVKIEFINRLKKIIPVEEKFPEVKLKKDNSTKDTPKEWLEYMSYDYNMITLQQASEYPMSVWFTENIGKGFFDFSWREQEAKRFYLTQKTKIEDFKEIVKAWNLDQIKDS